MATLLLMLLLINLIANSYEQGFQYYITYVILKMIYLQCTYVHMYVCSRDLYFYTFLKILSNISKSDSRYIATYVHIIKPEVGIKPVRIINFLNAILFVAVRIKDQTLLKCYSNTYVYCT